MKMRQEEKTQGAEEVAVKRESIGYTLPHEKVSNIQKHSSR